MSSTDNTEVHEEINESKYVDTNGKINDSADYIVLKCPANGQYYLNGLSSSYSFQYKIVVDKNIHSSEKDISCEIIRGVISDKEVSHIINRLNEQILSFWPCNTCFIIAYSCIPCTFGFSLLCPNYCVSQAEDHANRLLENVSMKSKYFERQISFHLIKSFFGSSHVEIRIPTSLMEFASNSRYYYDELEEQRIYTKEYFQYNSQKKLT